MFDLLAAISSVDPPSLVAWAVLVFAAGMYPVGIMLGSSCSPCCGQLECGCAAGVLPQTLTVTVDGFQDGQTQGPPLTALVFSSNFGSGAAGRLTAPGGDPDTDAGPAQSVILTSGGDGYARIARVQPSINASAFSGTGATFSVSLQQIEYEDRPAWEVASVSITNGGTGYPPNGSLSFGFESGGTEAVPAYATFSCGRTQPTVNASVYLSAGSGASLSVSLSQNTGWDGNTVWNVSSVTIENGGSGYSEWESVIFSSPDGEGYGYGIIGSVDENGAITSVSPSYSEFYKSDGVIASVSVDSYSRGVYYKDDASVPGESASITITVNQEGPTAAIAAGAAFTASVDTDTASSTFGQITGVIVASGGDKYLAWKWCEAYLNGLQVVLGKRDTCSWGKQDCGRNFLEIGRAHV